MFRCPICQIEWRSGDDHAGCEHFRGCVPFAERKRRNDHDNYFYIRLEDMTALEAQRIERYCRRHHFGMVEVHLKPCVYWDVYEAILRDVPFAL